MKWLVLSNSPYANGGFQTLTKELAKGWVEAGDSVRFMCFQANPYRQLCDELGFECQTVAAPAVNTRSIRPWNLLTAYRTLREIRPDALFMCNSGTPDFLPFLITAKRAGVKHVVLHHGTDVQMPEAVVSRRHLFGILPGLGLWRRELHASCRVALNRASLIFFNNQPQIDSWRHEFGIQAGKCQLWYPPMDVARFQSNEATRERIRRTLGVADRFVIGCVGHLNQQKSFHIAIEALSITKERLKNCVLLIAGEGPERSSLETQVERAGLGSRVIFLGDRDDVPELMNAFDVFCLPSTRANETLGIVILEAMATKVPAVVTDLPGPSRIAGGGERALVVPRGNATALADAWIELARNAELRNTLIASGFELSQTCKRGEVVSGICHRLGINSREFAC